MLLQVSVTHVTSTGSWKDKKVFENYKRGRASLPQAFLRPTNQNMFSCLCHYDWKNVNWLFLSPIHQHIPGCLCGVDYIQLLYIVLPPHPPYFAVVSFSGTASSSMSQFSQTEWLPKHFLSFNLGCEGCVWFTLFYTFNILSQLTPQSWSTRHCTMVTLNQPCACHCVRRRERKWG